MFLLDLFSDKILCIFFLFFFFFDLIVFKIESTWTLMILVKAAFGPTCNLMWLV